MGKQRPEKPFLAKRQEDGGTLFTKEADRLSKKHFSLKKKLVKAFRKLLRFVYNSQCDIKKSLELFNSRLKIAIFSPYIPEGRVKRVKTQALKKQKSDRFVSTVRRLARGLSFASAKRAVVRKLEALKKGVVPGILKNSAALKAKAAPGQVFAAVKAAKGWVLALYAALKKARAVLFLLPYLTRGKLADYLAFLKGIVKNAVPQSKRAFLYIKDLPKYIRAANEQMPFPERLKLALVNARSFTKKHSHYMAPASAALVLVICLVVINSFQFAVKATEGDRTIGVFSSRDVVDNAIASIEAEVKDLTGAAYKLPTDLSYSIVLIPKSKAVHDGVARDRLLSTAKNVSEMYALYIDGKIIAAADSGRDITSVLDEQLKAYREDNVVSIGFVNNVSVVKGVYPDFFRVTKDELANRLNESSKAATTYTVKKNDVMINIAKDFGMRLSELQALNPGVVPEKLREGEVLNISKEKPMLSVQVTKKLQYTEGIAFKTVETKDNTLAKNTKKVKVKGQEGVAQVLAEIYYLDGIEVSRNVLSRQVLKEPVSQQVLVGTKVQTVKLSSGSGKYTGSMRRPYSGYISSRYGYRGREFHTGVDLAGPIGSPIVAADGGTVSFAGYNGGYGRCVIINHGNGVQTLYAHCSKLLVKKGQKVSKGELIAKVGNTGRSTGPHCHFEVRINGKPVNPMPYIS